jgi:hypothetical protein
MQEIFKIQFGLSISLVSQSVILHFLSLQLAERVDWPASDDIDWPTKGAGTLFYSLQAWYSPGKVQVKSAERPNWHCLPKPPCGDRWYSRALLTVLWHVPQDEMNENLGGLSSFLMKQKISGW